MITYNSKNVETTGSLWFYCNGKTTNFNADIANTNKFKSFIYNAKLLENTEADGAKEILKNATIAVSLKHLSNFWRSLKMPLINCKVELKIKWTKNCVSTASGADNANANFENIIFTIKDPMLYIPVVTISKRQSKTIKTL